MGDPLRDRRPVNELVRDSQTIEITEEISAFERLAAAVQADLEALEEGSDAGNWRETRVSGWLQFGHSDAHPGARVLEGQLDVELPATCQRCLGLMRLPVSTELAYELKGPDDVPEAGHEGLETWELDEALIRPIDIVDEALVMALPLVAAHDDCVEVDASEQKATTTTPFASLRAQMEEANKD